MNFLKASALLLFSVASGFSQNNPATLPASARCDLAASADAGELSDGQIISGNGTITRKNWLPAAQQAAGYTISFPITRFATNEVRARFVPRSSGVVTLSLM